MAKEIIEWHSSTPWLIELCTLKGEPSPMHGLQILCWTQRVYLKYMEKNTLTGSTQAAILYLGHQNKAMNSTIGEGCLWLRFQVHTKSFQVATSKARGCICSYLQCRHINNEHFGTKYWISYGPGMQNSFFEGKPKGAMSNCTYVAIDKELEHCAPHTSYHACY